MNIHKHFLCYERIFFMIHIILEFIFKSVPLSVRFNTSLESSQKLPLSQKILTFFVDDWGGVNPKKGYPPPKNPELALAFFSLF